MSDTAAATNLYAQITEALIGQLEAGHTGWSAPWHFLSVAPCNPQGRAYQGINNLWLSLVGGAKGYESGVWGTYRAWQTAGAQVRRGEKSTEVILYTPVKAKDIDPATGERREFMLAKTYRVFAAEQCDGAEPIVQRRRGERPVIDSPEAIEAASAWFDRLGAEVRHGGDRAFYNRFTDAITLPTLEQFRTAAHYYGTRAHESVHWTGHASRCDRDMGGRFGDDAYAVEELVAELGAAMWCAAAGLTPITRDDHAGYLGGWLRVLRADPSHLRTVAARAQSAVNYMVGVAGPVAPVVDLALVG